MERLIRWAFVLVLLLGTAACNKDVLVAKFTPHPEAEVAKQAIDDWRTGHYDALRATLMPESRGEATDDVLRAMAAELPKGEPKSVKVVGAETTIAGGQHRYGITYEYEYDGHWLVAQAVVLVRGNQTGVVGIHGKVYTRSLEAMNAFTFANKGGLHLLMLFLAIVSPVFCLTVCVICIRTPLPGRKVLWALFTLVGVVTVHFNWTTGHLDFVPISFQIMGASIMGQPYGPWIIGVSAPVGAIIFLFKRKKLMARALAASQRARQLDTTASLPEA